MCMAAIGLVTTLASTAANVMGAVAQHNAQQKAFEQNAVNAMAAARDEHNQLTLREIQEQKKTSQSLHKSYVKQAEVAAETRLNAAEGGVAGISVDNLIRDVEGKSAWNRQVDRENYDMVAAQLTQEQRSVVSREKARIDSVQAPSGAALAGNIVGAVGGGLSSFSKWQVGSTAISM